MVCESPGAPQSYAFPDSCGGSFAFAHQADMINAAKGSATAVANVGQYFGNAPAGMATFLSNHDSFAGDRLWDQVGGNPAQYRLAAATNLLLSNTPFIYYGEEVGMAGAQSVSGDSKLRTPMSWTADTANAGFTTGSPFRVLASNVVGQNATTQLADPNSLHSFYKDLIALRKSRPSLMQGSFAAASTTGTVLSQQRVLGNERTLVVINYGTAVAGVTVNLLGANANLQSLWPATGASLVADSGGQASLVMPSQSVAVFAVTAP
jgi:glycosidase